MAQRTSSYPSTHVFRLGEASIRISLYTTPHPDEVKLVDAMKQGVFAAGGTVVLETTTTIDLES